MKAWKRVNKVFTQAVYKHKNKVFISFFGLLVVAMVVTMVTRREDRCKDLRIDIYPEQVNFVSQEHIRHILVEVSAKELVGSRLKDLNLHNMEKYVTMHPFVKDCQIYKDWQNVLYVTIEQEIPIARMLYKGNQSQYITTTGRLLPFSKAYTPRVLVVNYPAWQPVEYMQDNAVSHGIMKVLDFILQDAYWNKQVAEVNISSQGDLSFYPQIGHQWALLGNVKQPNALHCAAAFEKLKIFYTRILPKKGWDAYTGVDVRFEKQIVCKK